MKTRYLLLFFFMCITLVGWVCAASAQTVTVRLLNGKNGKPLSHFRVYIILGEPENQSSLDLKTDLKGEVEFEAKTAKTFQVRPIGTVPCREQPIGAPDRNFVTDEVLKKGLVTANDCGRLNPEPVRGQLTYIVRPATWLELFKN